MKFSPAFSISLQSRLALSYALFISLALGLLTLVINLFTGMVFTALVKDRIAETSGEIVAVMTEQYRPLIRGFDTAAVEAMGMYFVRDGYIVSVEDEEGDPVWDARSCDMQHCTDVINGIAARMEGRFRLKGGLEERQYPILFNGRTVGRVNIETYGPFFYSETESRFLSSINRLLLLAGIVITLFSVGLSAPLARQIARPVNRAAEAARRIARVHAGGLEYAGEGKAGEKTVRIPDRYRTRELAELSRSLNELAGELEEGERRQRQLSADIAHELRTPLSCLQGTLEAMIDGVYPCGPEQLESCHEEVLRLVNLVRDLNTLTGLEWETIALHKTAFDLARLLTLTAEQFRAAAREKGIEIKLDLQEGPVNADYDRLKQVFINLLSNAVQYTTGGTIRIGIEAAADSTWEVSIADTGMGIPAGDLPHVFERFYRSDKSRSRSTGGAGIGLAIAAAIVAAHGGTITAESGFAESGGADGGGSVFRVRLPGQ